LLLICEAWREPVTGTLFRGREGPAIWLRPS
jgi:hypothetical protein